MLRCSSWGLTALLVALVSSVAQAHGAQASEHAAADPAIVARLRNSLKAASPELVVLLETGKKAAAGFDSPAGAPVANATVAGNANATKVAGGQKPAATAANASTAAPVAPAATVATAPAPAIPAAVAPAPAPVAPVAPAPAPAKKDGVEPTVVIASTSSGGAADAGADNATEAGDAAGKGKGNHTSDEDAAGNGTAANTTKGVVLVGPTAEENNDTDCNNVTDDKAPTPYHCKTKKNGKFKGEWVDLDKQVVHQQTDNFELADLKNSTTGTIKKTYKENENLRDIIRGLSRSFNKPEDRCKPKTDCQECLLFSNAEFECGWCATKKRCFEMSPSALGPMYGSCPPGHWHPETCPLSCPEKTKYGCSVCLTDPHCGWCMTDNTCHDGNMDQPVDDSTCDCWRWGNCEQDCKRIKTPDCHCNGTHDAQNASDVERQQVVETQREKAINNGSIPKLTVRKNGTVECPKKDNGTAFDTDEDMIDADGSEEDMKAKYEDQIEPGTNSSTNSTPTVLLVATSGNSTSGKAPSSGSASRDQAYFSCKQTCFNSTCKMPTWRERFPLVTQYTTCKHNCLAKPCTEVNGSTACYEKCATKDCVCDADCKKEKAKIQTDYTDWLYANEVCVLGCRTGCKNAGRKEAKVTLSTDPQWATANRASFTTAFRGDALASLTNNKTKTGQPMVNVAVEWFSAAADGNGTQVAFSMDSQVVDTDDSDTVLAFAEVIAKGNFTGLKAATAKIVTARNVEVGDMPSPAMQHVSHNTTK